MPQIPFDPSQMTQPADRPLQTFQINADPNKFGAQRAQGEEELGKAGETAALMFQGLQNETVAREANRKMQEAMLGVQMEYKQLQGKDAVDGYQAVHDKAYQIYDQYRNGPMSPEARSMFDWVGMKDLRYAVESMATHAAESNHAWQIKTNVDQLDLQHQKIAAHWNEPDIANDIVGTAIGYSKSLSELQSGHDPNIAVAAARKEESALRATQIEAAIAAHDPVAARRLFNNYADILGDYREKADKETLEAYQTAQKINAGQTIVSNIMEANPNRLAQTAHEQATYLHANIDQALKDADAWAQKQYPNDPRFKFEVEEMVKGNVNTQAWSLEQKQAQIHDGLIDALNGPAKDGSLAPKTMVDFMAAKGVTQAWQQATPEFRHQIIEHFGRGGEDPPNPEGFRALTNAIIDQARTDPGMLSSKIVDDAYQNGQVNWQERDRAMTLLKEKDQGNNIRIKNEMHHVELALRGNALLGAQAIGDPNLIPGILNHIESDVQDTVTQYKADGKSITPLFDPQSKDYLFSASRVSSYVVPPRAAMAAQADQIRAGGVPQAVGATASPTVPAPAPELKSKVVGGRRVTVLPGFEDSATPTLAPTRRWVNGQWVTLGAAAKAPEAAPSVPGTIPQGWSVKVHD